MDRARWLTLSFDDQMGNLGTDVARAARAKEAGDEDRLHSWLSSVRELFDLTLNDPRRGPERDEIGRIQRLVEDYLAGENSRGSTAQSLDDYFVPFAVRSNEARWSRR
jgi:hypothetical protein